MGKELQIQTFEKYSEKEIEKLFVLLMKNPFFVEKVISKRFVSIGFFMLCLAILLFIIHRKARVTLLIESKNN